MQTKFDAATLHQNPAMAKDTGLVDDGSGKKDVSNKCFVLGPASLQHCADANLNNFPWVSCENPS